MNKPNDRLIRVIVAAGSFVLLIVIGKPLVDDYRELRAGHRELSELETEFDTLKSRDVRLQRVEATLSQQQTELLSRSTTPEKIQQVRDTIIGIVRQSGATLRSLEIEDGQRRRWAMDNDDPKSRRLPEMDMESDFELHTHSLTLVADGTLDAILEVTGKIHQQQWLMTVETLGMEPSGSNAKWIELELRISLYGLQRSIREDDKLVAATDSTRLK
ncbi:hypothetical protein LOC71_02345 [Rhodopirellula sp. JC740]|uniref:Uncharacterized protein n=1 Tax=Rhodopirellula halodulae TaxID=2894198 RepID=A0ABS8NC14_9BACT|nr:hypothetical protein [Rhodopirellula sp. JC740]MCC9641097.1 hypothetical protein [Rhodopirellula sp. JC740]